MSCPLDFTHKTINRYNKKTGTTVEFCHDCMREVSRTVGIVSVIDNGHTVDGYTTDAYEIEDSPPTPKEKKKTFPIRKKELKNTPLLYTLPGTHPAKDGDGKFFSYNMGHPGNDGNWHVETAHVKNCKKKECERCWDVEPDDDTNEAGPLFIESMNIERQISEMQEKVLGILQNGTLRTTFVDAWEFFFGRHVWIADTVRKQVGDGDPKDIKKESQEAIWEWAVEHYGEPVWTTKGNVETATIDYTLESGLHISLVRTKHKMASTLVPKAWDRDQRRNLCRILIGQLKKATPAYRKFNIYHYAVSFSPDTPYESTLDYKELVHRAERLAQKAGIFGGVMIFHPFRIPGEFNDRNEMSTGPHFHIIGFGSLVNGDAKQSWHLDMPTTDELYKEEGVVVKIMHYDRDNGHVGVVKSVFDTAEYVLSHQGIAWNKERVVGDLNGYNAWVLQHNEKNMLSFILPSPQSNNNYHDLLLDLGITEENKKNYSPLKDPVDFFDTIDIDKVTGDSLSWQKFLRSPLGNLVLHYIQMLKLSGEFPSTSKSNFTKKPRLHPIETIHWFGIMGNSKKHIVGIKREKKVFYCIPCDNEIPQSLMSYVRIRKPSDSVLGPKGPPDDPLSVDLGLKSPPEQWIPSTDIGEYFEEYMIKGKKHSGIFLVPDEYVEPVSNSVKRYLFV